MDIKELLSKSGLTGSDEAIASFDEMITRSLSESANKIQTLTDELSAATNSVSRLEAKRTELISEKQAVQRKVDELLTNANAGSPELQAELARLRDEAELASSKLDTLTNDHNALTAKHEDAIASGLKANLAAERAKYLHLFEDEAVGKDMLEQMVSYNESNEFVYRGVGGSFTTDNGDDFNRLFTESGSSLLKGSRASGGGGRGSSGGASVKTQYTASGDNSGFYANAVAEYNSSKG